MMLAQEITKLLKANGFTFTATVRAYVAAYGSKAAKALVEDKEYETLEDAREAIRRLTDEG